MTEDDLLGEHDLGELVVVDLPVAVGVGLTEHLGELLVGEFLAEVLEDVAELVAGDEAVLVLVEDAEGLPELVLVGAAGLLHLARQQGEELLEVDGAAAVRVHLVHHPLQLLLRRALPQRPHHRAQLLGRDRPCTHPSIHCQMPLQLQSIDQERNAMRCEQERTM